MNIKTFEVLKEKLFSMPGISKKQAEKIAFNIILKKRDEAKDLSIAIKNALDVIQECIICFNITENEICDICLDKNRERKLVVVESPQDIFKFEESNTIKPYYHVLGGLIDVSKDVELDELNIDELISRSDKFTEVILALSPNLEGIVTSNYLKQLLGDSKVTQLAQGIPLGAAMEYVDGITLQTAIKNRKEVK